MFYTGLGDWSGRNLSGFVGFGSRTCGGVASGLELRGRETVSAVVVVAVAASACFVIDVAAAAAAAVVEVVVAAVVESWFWLL